MCFALNFYIKLIFSHVLKAAINGKIIKKAAIIELAKSSQFICFYELCLYYESVTIEEIVTIEEKCKMFVNYLHDIEVMILKDVNIIHFVFPISKKCDSSFTDHLQLLNYLRKELLPVCGTPRKYKFELSFNYDYDDYPRDDVDTSGTNLIAQILQMHPINRCSNIEIMLDGIYAPPMQWPIEAISDWLRQKSDEIAEKSQKRRLKILSIESENFRNLQELCDHLREVKILNNFLKLQL